MVLVVVSELVIHELTSPGAVGETIVAVISDVTSSPCVLGMAMVLSGNMEA